MCFGLLTPTPMHNVVWRLSSGRPVWNGRLPGWPQVTGGGGEKRTSQYRPVNHAALTQYGVLTALLGSKEGPIVLFQCWSVLGSVRAYISNERYFVECMHKCELSYWSISGHPRLLKLCQWTGLYFLNHSECVWKVYVLHFRTQHQTHLNQMFGLY